MVQRQDGKPPLKMFAFELVLENPDAEPRWLVWPSTFPSPGTPWPKARECELAASSVGGALFVRGTCGEFWAVHLAPRARVTLRAAIDGWWRDPPEFAELDLIAARSIHVGGKAIETLFPGPVPVWPGSVTWDAPSPDASFADEPLDIDVERRVAEHVSLALPDRGR